MDDDSLKHWWEVTHPYLLENDFRFSIATDGRSLHYVQQNPPSPPIPLVPTAPPAPPAPPVKPQEESWSFCSAFGVGVCILAILLWVNKTILMIGAGPFGFALCHTACTANVTIGIGIAPLAVMRAICFVCTEVAVVPTP
jgi:hypothetical protein